MNDEKKLELQLREILVHVYMIYSFREFDQAEVVRWCMSNEIPSNLFFSFVKAGVIGKTGINAGAHYKLLEYKDDSVQKTIDWINKFNAYKAEKENIVKATESEVVGVTKIDEEYCINFLKNLGYRISKPIIEYKDI